MKTGLVLEGGGMRGMYTTGILDCLMDQNIEVGYIVGVSAGACNGVSYASGQRGRGYRINADYIRDKRYVSLSNFIKEKSIFGMNFLFDEITNRLEPLDYEGLQSRKCEFVVGVTNIVNGKTEYYDKSYINNGDATVLCASSSIPIFAQIVNFDGKKLLDGGTSDPIPAQKALDDGCEQVVIVLTRPRDYVKKKEHFKKIYNHLYRNYPKMIDVLDRRHEIYEAEQEFIAKLENEGKAIILAPKTDLGVSRFEKDKEKLTVIYDIGYADCEAQAEKIKAFIGR